MERSFLYSTHENLVLMAANTIHVGINLLIIQLKN